jgi:D-xylose 1-dehydrogenase (NADP+, D-xylono-1,5-lactone-forming)
MEPVRWGILSTARINDLFLKGVAGSEIVEVVAVGGRDRERTARFAAERGIGRVHDSYEALLADDGVEAVYIPVPNSMHVEWSIRALEAGKHVLCEKPLSRHPDQVERAFDVADRHGLLLMEAFMYRHNPQTRRLTELVADGAVGSLRTVRAAFSFNARDPANIRLTRRLEGGALMDVGCYCVSGTRLLAGEPERVYAEQVLGGDGVDVAFVATMRFPDEVIAHFDAGLALSSRDELEVIGEDGSLFLDDPWHARTPVIELRRDDQVERIEIPAEDSYGREADNFSRAIRGEAEPLLGRADALGQARAIEALYRSADAGLPVTLVSVP